jgi:hypothetical protein
MPRCEACSSERLKNRRRIVSEQPRIPTDATVSIRAFGVGGGEAQDHPRAAKRRVNRLASWTLEAVWGTGYPWAIVLTLVE